MEAPLDDRLLDLLVEAIDLEGTERDEFVQSTCAEEPDLRDKLGSLLDLEGVAEGFLEGGALLEGDAGATLGTLTLGDSAELGEISSSEGEDVGSYRVQRVLGKGGMGVVYLAEQKAPVQRQVALKVIKMGMDTEEVVARFEAERQALALMSHPHIAKVYDAGATPDGRPYFVMEHVEGVPLTEYCDAGRLSLEERLKIFVQTCRGVEHAHQKGILHRDIKPSNVLVSCPDQEPVVKIIDFGVAKATNQRLTEKTIYTEIGRAIGTPAYMSPEQAGTTEDDVDARTDVYSLGVFLYELLVGELPLDWEAIVKAAFDEIIRRVREEEPPPPSVRWSRLSPNRTAELAAQRSSTATAVGRALRGDLDWITMKALEKERSRRYASPSALADDVERFLRDEPVSAGPPGRLYRMGKFVRKNRGPVMAVGVIVLLLTAGLVATTWLTLLWRQESESVLRLADMRQLQIRRNEAGSTSLWPATPDRVGALEEWLVSAEELYARLPLHKKTLEELRARAARSGSAPGSGSFADDPTEWHRSRLQELIGELESFGRPVPSRNHIPDVRERLEAARTLRERSIDRERAAWDRAIASIGNRDECPAYDGMGLEPQLGLVPLGRNRAGLWEFAHLPSGEKPTQGEDGRWELEDKSGLILVLLPRGTFSMGATTQERQDQREAGLEPQIDPGAEDDESPVHRVGLEPFFLSKYEMTQAQWERFTRTNPSRMGAGLEVAGRKISGVHPVESVSWLDCERELTRMGLRLPTEAQWEYAARAGTTTVFWTGDDIAGLDEAANLADQTLGAAKPGAAHEPTLEDGWAVHAPVGAFRGNAFGLYDTAGNVREWCLDVMTGDYRSAVRPGDGSVERRIVRGGGWAYGVVQARSADRGFRAPAASQTDLGVRPARAVE